MIWFLAAPLVSRGVKYIAILGTSLVIVLLMGAPLLGYFVQPWSRWWLSGQHTLPVTVPNDAPVPVPVTVPIATTGPIAAPTLGPLPTSSIVDGVIALARTWLRTPYLWGGCDHRGIDCSCFMVNVFQPFGINLPRVTVDQIRFARPVAVAEARAGDLVFFDNTCTGCGANPTHVGLVISPGTMIDAGDPVQIEHIFSGHNARYGRVIN